MSPTFRRLFRQRSAAAKQTEVRTQNTGKLKNRSTYVNTLFVGYRNAGALQTAVIEKTQYIKIMPLNEPEHSRLHAHEQITEQNPESRSEIRNKYPLTLFNPYEIDSKPSAKAFWLMPLAALITVAALSIAGAIWYRDSKKPDKAAKAKIITRAFTALPGTILKNSIGLELVYIPPGDFIMGSSEEEAKKALIEARKYQNDLEPDKFANETPPRKISIRDGFWLGKYEVTQAQWGALMTDNPSHFKECGANCPVEQISWENAQVFIEKLNDENDGFEYSLPSEAEWEYAARAQTTTTFAFGDTLDSSQANFDGNFPYDSAKGRYVARTITVGNYQSNAFGLYDMHGNVWEWTQDIYNPDYRNLPTDGSANLTAGDSNLRVLRGGSWYNSGFYCRSAYRFKLTSVSRSNNAGFRVAARAK